MGLCCVFLARNQSVLEQSVPEAEYSSFLTIPEAAVPPWSSVSGCTPVIKQTGLKGCDLSANLLGELFLF